MVSKQVAALVALLTVSLSSHALVVDFESTPGGSTPTDNDGITGIFTDGTVSVQVGFSTDGDFDRDINATYENVGHVDGDPFGYFNGGGTGPIDSPNTPGAMGGFFARSNGFPADTSQIFIIDYVNALGTEGLSAEIWDIDGRDAGGSESWLVQAFDELGNELARLNSPIGNQGEFGPFNAEPWQFGFDLSDTGGVNIKKVAISYTGSAGNVGLAFDNFNADANVQAQVPEPTTIALLGLGAVMLVGRRHRKLG